MLWTSRLEMGTWDQSSAGEWRSGQIREAGVEVRITALMQHRKVGL